MLKLHENTLINNAEFINQYVDTCLTQIEKSSTSRPGYKNTVIKSL